MGTVRWSAPEYLDPERYGFGKNSRKRIPSKGTDIYALGMTVLEASKHVVRITIIRSNSRTGRQVITQRLPFEHMSVNAVSSYVLNGGRPERPSVGFSDALWGLLSQSWLHEDASMPPMRPSIPLFRAQLEQDGGKWVSVTGVLRALTVVGPCSLSCYQGRD
jgi:serine/threonine protein kinase